VLRALETPLLVTHGRADTLVLPAMAEHILATCPTAEPSGTKASGTPVEQQLLGALVPGTTVERSQCVSP
jgi:fermentation-respiration switch protein FrsA (DUF1100 family)